MSNIESDNAKKVKGIRIKRFNSMSIIIAAVLSVFFIFVSIKGILDFKSLEANTEQLIACENAAKDIRSASDLLTNDVRLFVMTSDRKYMDSYFEEANITRSREKAIEKFESMFPDNIFIADLNKAVSESEKLMQTEYYSMRLICDVGGFDKTTLDAEIINVSIYKEDNSLANDEKIVKAQNLVSNRNYEESKNTIIYNLDICLDGIVSFTENRQNYYIMVFKDVFIKLEIGLFILIVILLTSSFIVRKLIVKPLLTYNESIEKDQVFPVIGVVELQTLAENYNKVYEDNQETQRLIRHEAEHDALTGLLNRGSFNKVLPIYLNGEVPFSLILLDIDTFKFYNDNYGHQLGDKVIKRVASQLENTFSTKDYVFRIGGDEFAIIVVEMPSVNKDSISERLEKLKIELIKSEKDIPPVTISAGITFSDYEGENKMDVFRQADKALYFAKNHGRNSYSFYDELNKDK